ncbi:hypothetical protein EVAR_60175_1 [Eumeta japonica]|uniref:Uncharacterized protein n=1 Tax=Eumeta variegata TaxID=151549 RepID=A0A4C1Z1H9_EUMVA|nr:hypothetical protein EVAR_60175_1 [Eumeta japonica]
MEGEWLTELSLIGRKVTEKAVTSRLYSEGRSAPRATRQRAGEGRRPPSNTLNNRHENIARQAGARWLHIAGAPVMGRDLMRRHYKSIIVFASTEPSTLRVSTGHHQYGVKIRNRRLNALSEAPADTTKTNKRKA